jgi:hypothetical protein
VSDATMTEQNTNTQIPETFDLNETTLKRGPADQYATGVYKTVVKRAERKLCPYNESKDMGIELTLAALDTDNNVQKATVRQWFGIPVPNPLVPGHKVSTEKREWQGNEMPSDRDSYLRKGRELVRAVRGDDTLPRYPKKKEGTDIYIDQDTGDALSPQERYARADAIGLQTVKVLKEFYTNPEQLVDTVFFTGMKRKGDWARVSYVSHDAPAGKDVKYDHFFEEGV